MKASGLMFVIITVPHNCITTQADDRGCDINARKFGKLVAQTIDLDHVLFISDVRRKNCDMNRKQCRHRPMREDIRAYFHTGKTILIDIHTFPYGVFKQNRRITLGIMYQHNSRHIAEDLLRMIQKHIPEVRSAIFGRGTRINSIMHDALNAHIPALLIEFCQYLPESQVVGVAQCINKWIIDRGHLQRV